MDIGAILSISFSLYRRNLNLILPHLIEYILDVLAIFIFGIFTLIVAVLVLGSVSVDRITSFLYGPTPFLLIIFGIVTIAALILTSIFFNACARAATIGMAIDAKKNGKTSLSVGIESAKKRGPGIFGYLLAISLVPAFVIGVAISMVFVAAFLTGGVGEGAGMNLAVITILIFVTLLCLASYILISVLAMFSPQKIVIEGTGVIGGIKSSFAFVRAHPVGVVLYIGVAFVVVMVTGLIPMLFAVPVVVSDYLGGYLDPFIAMFFKIIENIASIVIGLLVTPYLETVKTLMVLDTRGEPENEVEKTRVL